MSINSLYDVLNSRTFEIFIDLKWRICPTIMLCRAERDCSGCKCICFMNIRTWALHTLCKYTNTMHSLNLLNFDSHSIHYRIHSTVVAKTRLRARLPSSDRSLMSKINIVFLFVCFPNIQTQIPCTALHGHINLGVIIAAFATVCVQCITINFGSYILFWLSGLKLCYFLANDTLAEEKKCFPLILLFGNIIMLMKNKYIYKNNVQVQTSILLLKANTLAPAMSALMLRHVLASELNQSR